MMQMNNAKVLKDGMNFGILIYERPGVYSGHWIFEARGREALKIADEMLQNSFNDGVEVILGLTPLNNKAAKWFNRKLGFQSHGTVGTDEIFVLTKEEYANGQCN